MNEFAIGQRWVSESEPELGLGVVEMVSRHQLKLVFPAAGEVRLYAVETAPIRRVLFHAGDVLMTTDGREAVVERVEESDGCLSYICTDGRVLSEADLSDTSSFSKTEDRLRAGSVDGTAAFRLRCETLERLCAARRSSVEGFVGGRIDLIPHQLYIADEVSGRYQPRVLLADEVGLGKTIEACLIIHRLVLTGRVQRVLILVPETLLHQWFVELLRRFNLWFSLFDEARCGEVPEAGTNPFLEEQMVLCGTGLLAKRREWAEAAIAASWDMLVVDEAHHLAWSEQAVSREYALVEAIAGRSEGLLLLTATPEQLGLEGHFARLRLLDPERYPDLEQFRAEQATYRAVAGIVESLTQRRSLADEQWELLRGIFKEMTAEAFAGYCARLLSKDEELAENALMELVDRHGTGRVMFRNTREELAGFPKRRAKLVPLAPRQGLDAEALRMQMLKELDFDVIESDRSDWTEDEEPSEAALRPDYTNGVRVGWLVELLKRLGDEEKVLLICRSIGKVLAIEEAVRAAMNVNVAVFHEDMTLIQRDRSAAWFADPDGARLMLCSEIGSEGRNFQFAHHLVLFDLPLDPELLEQRIGRLDRIGQTETIRVHVPYLEGSCMELLSRWHHEGLAGLEHSLRGGSAYLDRFGGDVVRLARRYHERTRAENKACETLIKESRHFREELESQLREGQSRLLALNSFRKRRASELVDKIEAVDLDPALDQFMNSVFDLFGVQVEDISPGTYKLNPGPYLLEALPGLAAEGMVATVHRDVALSREDVAFLTWDHPMVRGAMETLLSSGKGNCAFVRALSPDGTAGIVVEAIYVLECVAPPAFHVDRFLPATPVRVAVDVMGEPVTDVYSREWIDREAVDEEPFRLKTDSQFLQQRVPDLLKNALAEARLKKSAIVTEALRQAHATLDYEVERLELLSAVNENVRAGEVKTARRFLEAVVRHIGEAHLRLDSIRLVLLEPE